MSGATLDPIAALPERLARRILPVPGGACVIAQDRHLIAAGPRGAIWQVEAGGWIADAVVAADGRIAVAEGRRLVARDAATGEVREELELDGAPAGLVAAGDAVLLWIHAEGAAHLVRAERGRVERIAVLGPIDDAIPRPPWIGAREIVAAHGGALHGLAASGERWRADRRGFGGEPRPGETIATPILAAGDRTLLAGIAWREGHGVFCVELDTRRVRALEPAGAVLQVAGPMAIAATEAGARLIAAGVDRARIAVDLEGRVRWRHAAITPPIQLLAGAGGAVVAIHSPPAPVWDLYRDVYAGPQCFLEWIDAATGLVIGTRRLPGPIAPCAATGSDHLFLVSEGRLFAHRSPWSP